MRKFIVAAALAGCLGLAGSARADGFGYPAGSWGGWGGSWGGWGGAGGRVTAGWGGPGSGGYVRTYYNATPYYKVSGRAFHGGGYYYPGRDHGHWSRRVWSETHRRYHYYDPYLRCDYVYCPQRGGFYPVR